MIRPGTHSLSTRNSAGMSAKIAPCRPFACISQRGIYSGDGNDWKKQRCADIFVNVFQYAMVNLSIEAKRMKHATGKYVMLLLIAGLTTGALEPRLQPVPLDQEEYLEADDWFEAGVALNSEGRYREAAEAFGRSISIKPENALSWLNLGTAQALVGDYSRAIDALKKSVRLDPNLALGFSNLGEVCFRADRFEEAVEAYSTLLSLRPGNANALYKLGLAHLFLDDTGKAQAEYLSLKIIDPDLAEKLLHAINQSVAH